MSNKTNAQARKKTSFGRTFYWYDSMEDTSAKCPPQMQAIIKYMVDNSITSEKKAEQGSIIGNKAKAEGYFGESKLEGAVIFAYYIRRLERDHGFKLKGVYHARSNKKMA